MKCVKYLMMTMAFVGLLQSPAFGMLEEREMQQVLDHIEAKRNLSIKEKGGQLRIGGEVRVEYNHVHYRENGAKTRETAAATVSSVAVGTQVIPVFIPYNTIDMEARLSFDYSNENSYAGLLFQFDNNAGIDTEAYPSTAGSTSDYIPSYDSRYKPTTNSIKLARSYIGYKFIDEGANQLSVEVGRQRMYDLFTSRVMFASLFDGAVVKYQNIVPVGVFGFSGGSFLIDDRVNQYGVVAEFTLGRFLGTGAYAKYDIINWHKDQTLGNQTIGLDGTRASFKYRYLISQFMLGYRAEPASWNFSQPTNFYSGFLCNHKAIARSLTSNMKDNLGAFVGVKMGKIDKKGDWAMDLNYQYVESQAVPDNDSFVGVTRGNLKNQVLWSNSSGLQGVGFGNYRALQCELSYSLTDDMLLGLELTRSAQAHRNIGPTGRSMHQYNRAELELTYIF